DGPAASRPDPLGRMDACRCGRVQLRGRDRPPVLHRGHRAGRRGPRPHRGGVMLWRRRRRPAARAALCATVVGTAAMAFAVLDHSPKWDPWLRYLIVGLAIAGAVGIAAGSLPRRRLVLAAASLGVAAALLRPAAYSVGTVTGGGRRVGAAGPAIGGAQFGGGAPASRPGAESARGGSGGG